MSYRKDADKLLAVLAALAEDQNLALNEAGNCLTTLNGLVFAFSFDEERQCLFIQSHGGGLGEVADPAGVLERVLEANHLWQGTAGGVLGLDEQSGELGLTYRLDFPLPGEEFPENLLCELMPYLAGVTQWCRDQAAYEDGHSAA